MSNTIEISKIALEATLNSHIESAKRNLEDDELCSDKEYWKGYRDAMKFLKKDIKRYQVISFGTKERASK